MARLLLACFGGVSRGVFISKGDTQLCAESGYDRDSGRLISIAY